MPIEPANTVYYKRARFTSRLPASHRYDPSHFWLAEEEPGVFRIGFTKFAARMLGDFVEMSFNVKVGEVVELGQPIGELEGFKALSDIYCAAQGEFLGSNPAIETDPSLVDRDPYDAGWLYRVKGKPNESVLDVDGYVNLLDATIDQMLRQQAEQDQKGNKSC